MMYHLLAVAIAGIVLSMALIMFRALKGPTPFDRILSVNLFGTCAVLAIAVLSFLHGNVMYLDMALLYGMINFIATIALLRFFKFRSFSHDD